MSLPINSTGSVYIDRALEALERRLRALETAGSNKSASQGMTPSQALTAASGSLIAQESDGSPYFFALGVEIDQSVGFALTQNGNLAKISRTASATVPAATAGANAAGTATDAANADHVHLLKVPLLSADPASPTDGEIWYRTDTDKLSIRTGGATKRSAAFT